MRCRKASPWELSRRYDTQHPLQGSSSSTGSTVATLASSPLDWGGVRGGRGGMTYSWKHLHINNAPFQGELTQASALRWESDKGDDG